jgi:multiple sugar transport system ATP-binding protein
MSSFDKPQATESVEGEQASAAEDAHVKIEYLKKTFDDGEVIACENIDLDVHQGEFVVLLGPSGCGKTTTLRCIAGLEIPDSGRIVIDGEDVTTKKPRERDLAFVFQSIALFPHMSVRRNIRFGLDMTTDLSPEEKEERVQEAADILGINELLARKPSALSGGQQQRVSLGRAMVIQPDAFLLDEPFSALDANLRDQMRVEVQRLQSRLDIAMIFVTHDQEEAMMLADKLVVMNDGEIEQVGTPDQIYNDPQTRFIAEFIGSPPTNFFECDVLEESGDTFLSCGVFSLTLPDEQAADLPASRGDAVSMAVRPEVLSVGDEGLFDAQVMVVEPHGDRAAIYLETDDGTEVTVLSDDVSSVATGDTVGVDLPPDSIRLFSRNNERIL